MSVAVRLEGVGLSYPVGWSLRGARHHALRDISLTLSHGDRLGVIGGNGSGKSTLLRVIGDLLVPDSGVLTRSHGPCQLLSLNLGFMPHLSGRQNMILSGLLQGFDRRRIDDRLEAIKEFSELGDFFELPFRTYSSGMRSRLGFSLAMELSPDILLIDEALGVGDAAFQEKSRQALSDKIHSGLTVVVVSHSHAFLRQTCTSAVWLDSGCVAQVGQVDEVLDAYVDSRKSEGLKVRFEGQAKAGRERK